jgi:hypothetical protein
MNRNPTRPVRGPRIAVGVWNVDTPVALMPVPALIVSAAYEFRML